MNKIKQIKPPKMKFINKKTRKIFFKYWVLIVGFSLLFTSFYMFILKDLPSPVKLSSLSNSKSTQIYDRNDKLLYSIYANKNQTFVPLASIPGSLQKATIAIEDKDFYKHGAIDVRGITRALYSTIFHKQIQGGSTITQQLVKTSLLSPEQTIPRKIKEVALSFVTEMLYPKNKILEMYLNQIPYGGTAWGAEAAARTYFGKSAKNLTTAEAALLAGLPEAPSVYSPFGAHPELAKKRQEEVLRKMYEQGYVNKKQMEEAVKEPLKFQKVSSSIQAPHFVLYVKDLLIKKYGSEVVEQGGLKVKTSLDLDLQDFAQASVAAEVENLNAYSVHNGAALITNPKTGEILAMVGSKDYFDNTIDGNVNVTLARRQPGSSIKPVNYAVGLIHGYTAATPFIDQAVCFPSPGHAQYCPLNYDGKWHGVVQMRQALGNSINIPAVKMLKLNGIESMIATASAMGISTFSEDPSRYGLSLTLGGGEVTMLDMATAYGVFANQGYRIDLHPILKVVDNQGKVLEEYTPPTSPIFGKKVLPTGVTYIISQILSDNGAREMAFGPSSELKIADQIVSVKTGTTNDFRDNWTIGYTPSFLVAVWVGNNDNTPMGGLVSGVTGAAPIWHDLMANLLKDKKPESPQKPDDVVGANVCSTSGLLPSPEGTDGRCPTRFEYFIKGTVPYQVDSSKQKVWIDKSTNDLAKPGQTDNVEEKDAIVVNDATGDRYCLSCPHPEPSPTPH
ncbi:MAG: transglycosylase domain-containing protein [bacterium]|nr:transglycosylase domain-containing protein [bacterium]